MASDKAGTYVSNKRASQDRAAAWAVNRAVGKRKAAAKRAEGKNWTDAEGRRWHRRMDSIRKSTYNPNRRGGAFGTYARNSGGRPIN